MQKCATQTDGSLIKEKARCFTDNTKKRTASKERGNRKSQQEDSSESETETETDSSKGKELDSTSSSNSSVGSNRLQNEEVVSDLPTVHPVVHQ